MKEKSLGDKISNIIFEEYSKLKSSSKPTTRSNNVKEWTVLAAIVAISNDENEIIPITISTGVKATPNDELERSSGKILHDCHSEILSLRAFNTYLLQSVQRVSEGDKSKFILPAKADGKYNWNENYKIALYISKLPCGDASMDTLNEDLEDNEQNFTIEDNDAYQFIDPKIKTVIRGRLNYSKKNVVRTKPGRYDSNVTLSKSCSDKLCMKQAKSILNSLNWDLFENPIFLAYVIIPTLKDELLLKLNKEFPERLRGIGIPIMPLTFLTCVEKFIDDKTEIKTEPALVSSIKILLPREHQIEQSIVNGVRNGSYTKKNKPLKKNCQSDISKYSQWQLFKTLKEEQLAKSYIEYKKSQTLREDLKDIIKSKLSPDGWISTFQDDCF
ncbi:hypothetical protein Kpol_380p7 [Vanderwaltozyma polyspora DSM 70294]|uniref:A to I editase domain-containing protein n=1 Tax=Vanderwaltozyma polyspora (strain ATCC 22028 / DSM 70294 / BCRC 21397 / CBS 2163 / NBRC 10782 / NRRL Y-8283 / UCD 57-17) TaxID=436907 RepID=A7TS66_VANPO|nr:uncharacterized protein Kpol_380p7 [Vanderwaltozyma polyspora DSM 70294]EDO14888.1 hypothetical protein Kpol_380p7 [Vanderwaltozyma polyspora DSM 70294]